jgi:hypothetical protein
VPEQPTSEDKLTALHDAVLTLTKNVNRRLDAIEEKQRAVDDRRGKRSDDDEDPEETDDLSDETKKKIMDGEAKSGEPEPMSSDDRRDSVRRADELAETQYRWQEVARSWGERARGPLDGDTPRAYALRQMRRWQKYSRAYAPVDLSSIRDKPLFAEAQRAIAADALAASYDPVHVGANRLREVHKIDHSGRKIIEFVGDVETTLAPFKLPTFRVKNGFRNPDKVPLF